jgi:hypothetical protein
MSEHKEWFSIREGRGAGVDFAPDEPSHIHVPRRRRVVRPASEDTSATWTAPGPDAEHRAAPTDSSARASRGPSTAPVLDAA